MATTQESVHDTLRWVVHVLRIGLRRAVVIGILVALFAVTVVLTTRETVSDCSDVSDEQRVVLESMASPASERSFRATVPAGCTDGEFSAPISGVAESMEAATDQLTAEGWVLETNYIGYHVQLWRRCFRFDAAGWERVQITVDATRDGSVHAVRVIAPEHAEACAHERRETSEIFPP